MTRLPVNKKPVAIHVVEVHYLAMGKSSNSHVPSCVGDHNEAEERPEPVVSERWHQHSEHATGPKDVSPLPLVQMIVDQKDVAAMSRNYKCYCQPQDKLSNCTD